MPPPGSWATALQSPSFLSVPGTDTTTINSLVVHLASGPTVLPTSLIT